MSFLVIEQPLGADKTRGCKNDQDESKKDQGEPLVTAKRPREPFELLSTIRIERVRICYREHKQVELLDDEPERYHGDGGADSGEKGSLVRSMITAAADHSYLIARPNARQRRQP